MSSRRFTTDADGTVRCARGHVWTGKLYPRFNGKAARHCDQCHRDGLARNRAALRAIRNQHIARLK